MNLGERHPDGNFHTPVTRVRCDADGNVIERKSAVRRTLLDVFDDPDPKVNDGSAP